MEFACGVIGCNYAALIFIVADSLWRISAINDVRSMYDGRRPNNARQR